MGQMPGRRAHLAVILALPLAGCGSSTPAPLPVACLAEPPAITRALERAPADVRLAGGTRLSTCVRMAAARDGDLQAIALTFTQVADGLRDRAAADPVAALRLGYLVGAARRGAAQTPGVAAQLARRLEQVATPVAPAAAARSELQRGMRLGEARG
jgi:hypothetical protein